MYIIQKLEPNQYLLKIYTPCGRGTYSYNVKRYTDALQVVQGIGLVLKQNDLILAI